MGINGCFRIWTASAIGAAGNFAAGDLLVVDGGGNDAAALPASRRLVDST